MASQSNDQLNCKVIIVGDSGVGKTSLMNKFCHGSFSTNLTCTVGSNVESKHINIFDKTVNIMIWDTAGQEQYFALTKVYFRYSMGVVFVYDVTREQTLINMEKWFKAVEELAPPGVVKILVGHKCDEEEFKEVSVREGKAVADRYGVHFCEVSSKENINVDSIFYLLAEKIVDTHFDKFFPQPTDTITLEDEDTDVSQRDSNCWLGTLYNWFL